jgi:HEAT repeat protein
LLVESGFMTHEMNGTEESKAAKERATARAVLEQKSSEELFAAIKEMDEEDDAAWEAVTVLRLRGTADVFQTAKEFSRSENPKARASALRVLAQLGAGKPDVERPFLAGCVSIALIHLEDENEEVVRAAAWALSHLCTQDGIQALIKLRSHSDPDVRLAVASCTQLSMHPEVVKTLSALMEDETDEVRNWATFNLGSLVPIIEGDCSFPDSPDIRIALRKRLEDTCEDARREAIWGLARRRDPVGLGLLLQQLESEDWWSGDEMAAEETLGLPSGTPIEELRQGLRECLYK